MITPLRNVGAGGDQENVKFLVLRWVTVKCCGGPVGAGDGRNGVLTVHNWIITTVVNRILHKIQSNVRNSVPGISVNPI